MAEKKARVLIVDDQPNWRGLFSDLLEEEYEVTSVGSYQEALKALDRDPPFQVAVVDIRLDDKDQSNEGGLRLIERINDSGMPTKSIIVTGYPSIQTSRRAFRDLDVSDYIEKYPEDGRSFDIVDFRRAVNKAMEESFADQSPSGDIPKAASIGDNPRRQKTLPAGTHQPAKPIALRPWSGTWRKTRLVPVAP